MPGPSWVLPPRAPSAELRLILLEDLAPRWFLPKAAKDLDETATILFTSGSSALPKGVVLSHLNVLANVEMVREVFPWAPRDAVLGVLPFFHSFGYTVTLWLSLLSGMGVAYHVHPMQAEEIGRLAAKDFYKVEAPPLLGTGKLDLKAVSELAARLANPS